MHHPDWAVPALPLLLRREDPDGQSLSLLSPPSSTFPLLSFSLSIATRMGSEDKGWHPKKVVVLHTEHFMQCTHIHTYRYILIHSCVATEIYYVSKL